jgi:hypothetical protein
LGVLPSAAPKTASSQGNPAGGGLRQVSPGFWSPRTLLRSHPGVSPRRDTQVSGWRTSRGRSRLTPRVWRSASRRGSFGFCIGGANSYHDRPRRWRSRARRSALLRQLVPVVRFGAGRSSGSAVAVLVLAHNVLGGREAGLRGLPHRPGPADCAALCHCGTGSRRGNRIGGRRRRSRAGRLRRADRHGPSSEPVSPRVSGDGPPAPGVSMVVLGVAQLVG